MRKRVLFLIGPTGSGKSKLALSLAKKIKGEIISCDSMQVYRGMDIGTAKPDRRARNAVRHHLIDLFSPRAECSVFKHRCLALRAIDRILAKGRTPILAGGSGLYFKAIVDGLAPQPGKQVSIRQRLETLAKREGLKALYGRLEKADPKRAHAIHPNDKRRVIRALEILESSRRSPSDWERQTRGLESRGIRPIIFGLLREREELYRRIEKRVDQMFTQGWIEEVRRLRRIGFSKTARDAIGYREILEYLRGERTLMDARSEIIKRTRHLVKKQMTWFRREKRIHWLPISGESFRLMAVRKIVQELGRN